MGEEETLDREQAFEQFWEILRTQVNANVEIAKRMRAAQARAEAAEAEVEKLQALFAAPPPEPPRAGSE